MQQGAQGQGALGRLGPGTRAGEGFAEWAPLPCKGTNLHLPANPVEATDFKTGSLAVCSTFDPPWQASFLYALQRGGRFSGSVTHTGGGVALPRAGACFHCPVPSWMTGLQALSSGPTWHMLPCVVFLPLLAPWLIPGGREKPIHGAPRHR